MYVYVCMYVCMCIYIYTGSSGLMLIAVEGEHRKRAHTALSPDISTNYPPRH